MRPSHYLANVHIIMAPHLNLILLGLIVRHKDGIDLLKPGLLVLDGLYEVARALGALAKG